ncbi:hypothetical protein EZS27_040768, partial [termite gut metagenome]
FYRLNKGNPIRREEIESLNILIAEVGFKIPELWNEDFLKSLFSEKKQNIKKEEAMPTNTNVLSSLRDEYIELVKLDAHTRGYAFQNFLIRFFEAYGLNPKSPFRLIGEEIDGSFELNNTIYLLEAKWQTQQTSQKDLAVFSVKVAGKSTWSRGLFISYAGYTTDGLEAFSKGKSTNLIGMDGQDLFFILDGKMKLDEAIQMKARHAAETNDSFILPRNLYFSKGKTCLIPLRSWTPAPCTKTNKRQPRVSVTI